ncbi:MAG: type VI secretion system protein TssA [Aquisalimonadaceae bacterium]
MDLDIHTSLNVDALLAPVSDDAPTGIDLRDDGSANSVYYTLRDARTNARNSERTALGNGDVNYISAADWSEVLDNAPTILRERSKDMEAVAWLIEALTRIHGFQGVAVGFSLARRLIETFGEALHPHPDEDGKASQLAALTGLNGQGSEGALIAPLKSIPLTGAPEPGPFSTWQCEQAFEVERISDPAKREARSRRGFITREEIDQAVAATPPQYLVGIDAQIRNAIDAYRLYQKTIDAYCGDDPQPTARIIETLEACLQTLTFIAGDRISAAASASAATATTAGEDSAANGTTPSAQGIDDRQRALNALREVAVFFRRTEPHSPVSYAIEQAVYWSQMSLPELIGELIPDEGARQKYRTLTGIRSTNK